jgi:phosphatidylinositol-3-phosphatase
VRGRWGTGPLILAVGMLVLGGCSSGGSDRVPDGGGAAATAPEQPSAAAPAAPEHPSATAPAPKPSRPDHVMVVVFENKDADAVVGASKAPYLTSLAAAGAAFTDAHGETHPSQPNYLALFSGSTQGVSDDRCPVDLSGDNLGSQLLGAGLTFVGYSEGLPGVGYTGCSSGDYARKHNPWVDFRLPASVNQPLSALPADYTQLPTVSFVVPDLCHDMHNCNVATGDAWARDHLDGYVSWARQHNSLLIVTFDEDSGTKANLIPTVVTGAGVRAGTIGQRIDHYDLLRTLEDLYGLPPLGEAATASPLTTLWSEPAS